MPNKNKTFGLGKDDWNPLIIEAPNPQAIDLVNNNGENAEVADPSRISGYGAYPVYDWSPTPYQQGKYNSKYTDLINAAADKIQNWNYDPTEDIGYRTYARQYMRNGANAYEDTLARIASRTGGVASSYASAAAQQQYNNYMADLASKVPELEQLAYQKAKDTLSMYTGLDETDYNRWNNDEQRRYAAWAALQNASQSAYNQRYNASLNKYNAALDAYNAANQKTEETPKDYSTYIKNAQNKKDYNAAEAYLETVARAKGWTDEEIFNMLVEAGYDPINDSLPIDYDYAAFHNSWGEGRQEDPDDAYRQGLINKETYDYIMKQRENSKNRR